MGSLAGGARTALKRLHIGRSTLNGGRHGRRCTSYLDQVLVKSSMILTYTYRSELLALPPYSVLLSNEKLNV